MYGIYWDKLLLFLFCGNLLFLKCFLLIMRDTATLRGLIGMAFGISLIELMGVLCPLGKLSVRMWIVSLFLLYPIILFIRYPKKNRVHKTEFKKYLVANLLFGTAMNFVSCMSRSLSVFDSLMSGIAGILLSSLLFYHLFAKMQEREERESYYLLAVHIPMETGILDCTAFWDSGNHLTEPISQEPVLVLSEELSEKLTSLFQKETYRPVPFQTVYCERGYLDSYLLTLISAELDGECIVFHNVRVALGGRCIPDNSPYQMLWHPSMLKNKESERIVKRGRKTKQVSVE